MGVNTLFTGILRLPEMVPVCGIALVGSHARGDARPDSDVDMVILVEDPQSMLTGSWVGVFGEVVSSEVEDYGALISRRVLYSDGVEVEFGFARPSWVDVPLDEGTRTVLAGGVRVLYDPDGLFAQAMLHAGTNTTGVKP